jgi:hypothetical protein
MGEEVDEASPDPEHWVTSRRNRLLKGLSTVSFANAPSSRLYVKVKTWPSRASDCVEPRGTPADDQPTTTISALS